MITYYKGPDKFPDMPLPVAKRLGYAIKLAQHGLRLRMDEALRPLGLTTPQYGVLCALEAQPGLSNARLARALFVTAQTMHGVLSNLEREGLVERQAASENGRAKHGTLTARGTERLDEAHGAVERVEARMMDALGAGEATRLTASLLRCAEHLG